MGYVPSDIQEEEVSEESIEDYLIIDEIIEIPESDDNELQKEWQQTETVYDDEEELIEVLDDGEEEETLERNAYVDSSTKFEYTLSGNEAVITGYSGSSSVITIPTSVSGYKVTGIGSYAFENSTMTTLTIPSTITSIGYRAFFNCQKLSFINFNALNCNNCDGNGGTFYNAGQSAASLTVTFGNGVKRIPANLFYVDSFTNYAKVTSVVMSNTIQEIGNSAFNHCCSMQKVTWSTAVVTIGEYAFSECLSLTSVTIPAATTSIGYRAFYDCEKLSSINFNALNCNNCDGNGGTFYNAGQLASSLTVTFGNGVKRIPADLFYVSTDYNYGDNPYAHITSVVLSNTIQEVGYSAFSNCYDIKNISWGTGIVTIGDYAFSNCIYLSSVTIPSVTKSIGYRAFYDCASLSSITFNALNCNDCNSYGFYNAGYAASSLNVTVGSGVKKIPAYLFDTDENYNYGDGFYAHITSVTLPASVQEIGRYSFGNCYDLKTVTINNKSMAFNDYSFYNCLSSLTFKCYQGSTADTYAKNNGFKRSYMGSVVTAPSATAITGVSNTSYGVKLQWRKASGASGYYIYRQSGQGSWYRVGTTSSLNYVDWSVSNGQLYRYRIYAYNSGGTGNPSSAVAICYVSRTKITSIKNNAKKALTIKWGKNTKASGYQIQYSVKSHFSNSKTKTIGKAATTSKKLTGLKKGKTYYIRIRSYKTVSGKKYYSAWSTAVKKKISK